jgi:hypothetical protein
MSVIHANPLVARCRVRNTVGLSIPSGAWTVLTFNTDVRDDYAMHDTSLNTDKIVVPYTGWYEAGGIVDYPFNATGARGVGVLANGTDDVAVIFLQSVTVTVGSGISTHGPYYMTAGQSFQLRTFQNSGGALTTNATSFSPAFWCNYLGA